ncbi:uncharacterized protein LOC125384427 isoform X3 [Haliotis rufescens]|uniref:uncharacterized protein LOC125384427 isoform X3 n=1 Tax=Haliotis rufescens TaxID=6454 RepID=UPI00201EBA7D|nr:uncharacterized protein LOC125384427 isoform X3 [Haliotis rufescens]
MPPPKKPKSGPTSAEQFLSKEELSKLTNVELATAASTPAATPPASSGEDETPTKSKHGREGVSKKLAHDNKGHVHILKELCAKRDESVKVEYLPETSLPARKGKSPPHNAEHLDNPRPDKNATAASSASGRAQREKNLHDTLSLKMPGKNMPPFGHVLASKTTEGHYIQVLERQGQQLVSETVITQVQHQHQQQQHPQQQQQQQPNVVPAFCQSMIQLPPSNTSLTRSCTSTTFSGASALVNQLPPYLQDNSSVCSPHSQTTTSEPYDLSLKKVCAPFGRGVDVDLKYHPDISPSSTGTLPAAAFVAFAATGQQHSALGDHDKLLLTSTGRYLNNTQGISTKCTSDTTQFLQGDGIPGLKSTMLTQVTPNVMSILTGGKPTVLLSDQVQTFPVAPLSRSSVSTDSGISGKESLPGSPLGVKRRCLELLGNHMNSLTYAGFDTFNSTSFTSDLAIKQNVLHVRECSGTKSPKEEGRMVSPGACIPVQVQHAQSMLPAGAHPQAPTSTTTDGLDPEKKFLPPIDPRTNLVPAPHPKQEMPSVSGTSTKLCQVCNDNASGFHYGVWSCEGCKAFFKRSIQGPVDYVCPATNNCTIDKHRRKSCQACRLRKCYEVGMNKGSQRKERKSSGGSAGKGKRCRADSTDAAINSTSGGSAKCAKRSRCHMILEALQKADLPVLESYHNHNLPPTRIHLLNTLVKLADRELVYLINWAKHVPGYTDLSLSDQVHLIECCWMELLLLNCAFRSMDHEGKRLVFAPDFHLDRHHWNITGMTEILEQVAAVSEQMVQYSVGKEELLLLQATVLVNAEVRRLASFSKIQEMRQLIVGALMEVVQKYHADDVQHFASMLLLLTHIRQAGERGIACFQQLKREGCVTFCDLLTEMLEAHNSTAERKQELEQLD